MGSYRSKMVYRYFKLPDTLYDVRVPRIATMTDAEIELLGLPITVVDGHLEVKERDFVNVMLNLNRILDIYINGFPIYLVHESDIKSMYKAYEDYVNNFRNDPNRGIDLNDISMLEDSDRLKELEKFLNSIFDRYKAVIYKQKLQTISPFASFGFASIEPATIKMNINGQTISNTGDDLKVGHLYDYSTAPTIDIDKIKRPSFRKTTKF